MSRDVRDLAPRARELAAALIEATAQAGFPVFITSTLRTFHEQDELYAQGRTAPGAIVTNARGGRSRHNHGLAFDVAFARPPAANIGRLRRGINAARANVTELQTLLQRADLCDGGIDGDFGPLTEGAVQTLQRDAGLLPSGMVQPQELEALHRLLA